MRALVLDGKLEFRRDYPDPRPNPGESLVKVRVAGICGTDLELTRGYMSYRGVPGHEFVGQVAESADNRIRGKRVVGEINAECGRCDWCMAGMGRHCPKRTVLGILGRNGAFADYLCLPDENLIPLPDSLADEVAVFAEPLAAAYEIFEQTPIARNETIAILGDGRLGAMVAMALKAEGYLPLVAGHHDEKLEVLAGLGLVTEREEQLSPGFAVVIDCTGSSDGLRRALGLVRPRGKLILKSTAAAGANLNLAAVVVNEVQVVGSRCGRFGPALAALAGGRIDPRPLISAWCALGDGVEAFERAARPSTFKTLLRID